MLLAASAKAKKPKVRESKSSYLTIVFQQTVRQSTKIAEHVTLSTIKKQTVDNNPEDMLTVFRTWAHSRRLIDT